MTSTTLRGEGLAQLATTGCFFVAGLTFTSYVTFATELARGLGLSASQIGLLMSAFSFAYGGFQLVAGALTASMRKRDVLLLSLAIMGLSSLLFGFLTQYHWLLVLRIFMGMGAALVVPTATHILSERLARPKLGPALGVLGSGWGMGTLFAFYALALILPIGGYPLVMAVVAAIAALAAIPVLFFLPRGEPAPRYERTSDLWAPFFNIKLNTLALLGLGATASYMAIVTFTPVYLEAKLASSTLQANLLTGVVGLSLVAGAFLGGWLVAVLGRFFVALSNAILAVLLVLALPAMTNEFLIAMIVVLVGWVGFASFPAIVSTIPYLVPSHQFGAASGYVNGLGFGLALVSPFVVGFALDLTGSFTFAFLSAVPLTLLGLFGVLVLRKELGWHGKVIAPAGVP